MNDILGWPEAKAGSIFKPQEEIERNKRAKNPEWAIGAAMTILIINSEEIWCGSIGDCKAVMSTIQGKGP